MQNRIASASLGPPGPNGNGGYGTGPGGSGGRADVSHLRELFNFVQRNRLLVLGIPLLVIIAAFIFVMRATPVYDANAWVRIDEQRSQLPVLDALQSLSQGDEIHTEMAVLMRRPLAEEVVDSLALQVVVGEPDRVPRARLLGEVAASREAGGSAYRIERDEAGDRFAVTEAGSGRRIGTYGVGEVVRLPGARFRLLPGLTAVDEVEVAVLPFEEALKGFRQTLEVSRPDRDADLLRIRYQGTDSVLVHEVPNAMARAFIRDRERVRTTEARSTVVFLQEQIASLSGQLRTAEGELERFREANNIVDLEHEAEFNVARYSELRVERDRIQAEREALGEMLAQARTAAARPRDPLAPSPYRDLIAFPTLFVNFSVSELFRSMSEVENQRAQLLNLRTPEDPDVQVLTARVKELEQQLRSIAETYLQGLSEQVTSFNSRLAEYQTELQEVPAKEIAYLRMFRTAEVLEEIHTLLQTRLKEAEIAAAVEDPSVRVVEPAVVPVDPIRPNKPLTMILALMLGLGLGAGAAFVRENLDSSIHTREDLQEVAPMVPVLGLIPRIQEAATNGRRTSRVYSEGARDLSHRLIAGRDPRSPISEAYRSLRTSVTFSSIDRPHKVLVFTSALPGDGKSTSAANLAITQVQQGLRVLLVDADMRKGVLHEVFGELRAPGLSDVLVQEVELTEAVRRVDLGESGTLEFLPSGTLPPNPAELVGSDRTRALLERLEGLYDVVIFDAPPLNLVTDAALLGSVADGVIVVARSGVTDRGAVAYAFEQLQAVRARVIGAVLNDIDVRKDRYYGSYGLATYERYAAEMGDKVGS